MKLAKRVAVVTGAGSGIGRVIAAGFAAEGAHVALIGRREVRLQETARLCGESALVIPTDVGDEAAVRHMRNLVLEKFGRCDILVNNAGTFKPAPGVLLHEATLLDWEDVMHTNLRGTFLCLRTFTPIMMEQKYGRVINLTSGLKHTPGHGVYSISKSAIDALTKTAAQELRPYNILVNALNPGWVHTEMATTAIESPAKVVPVAIKMATLPEGEPGGIEFQA